MKTDIEAHWDITFDDYFAEDLALLQPLADDGPSPFGDGSEYTQLSLRRPAVHRPGQLQGP
mgnify:CR=1 FL=1